MTFRDARPAQTRQFVTSVNEVSGWTDLQINVLTEHAMSITARFANRRDPLFVMNAKVDSFFLMASVKAQLVSLAMSTTL